MMPYKILIIEDNRNNRTLLWDILTFNGYEVSVAVNGQEGVTLARDLMPDLILMDIHMPGFDGMTAGRILKGDPVTSGLKIVALTSFVMHGDLEKIMAAGFDNYLSKPISARELPGLINLWLGGEGNHKTRNVKNTVRG
jgi:CheY-like chemotaxis protein